MDPYRHVEKVQECVSCQRKRLFWKDIRGVGVSFFLGLVAVVWKAGPWVAVYWIETLRFLANHPKVLGDDDLCTAAVIIIGFCAVHVLAYVVFVKTVAEELVLRSPELFAAMKKASWSGNGGG